MEEKRYFSRINFKAQSRIEFDDRVYEGELLDLSLKGALICFKEHVPLEINDNCMVKISLNFSDVTLVFDAVVTHTRGLNMGFKFIREDIDTMTHLRTLLSINVGDYDKITDELEFWLKK